MKKLVKHESAVRAEVGHKALQPSIQELWTFEIQSLEQQEPCLT